MHVFQSLAIDIATASYSCIVVTLVATVAIAIALARLYSACDYVQLAIL